MRIAATDYDGTLYMRRNVAAGVLDAIRRWRAAGNLFGIITGRDKSMTLYETERWNIPFDFLVCCNGAVLYDRELRALYSAALDDAAVPRLLAHPAAEASLHFELCRSGETLLHILRDESWFPSLGPPYTEVGRAEAAGLSGLQQVCFAYPSAEEAERYAKSLNADFAGQAQAWQNGGCIDVTPPGIAKDAGIARLLEHYGLPESSVLVVGDGENDIGMLRRYHGYAVERAGARVKAAASGVVADVGAMLVAHM